MFLKHHNVSGTQFFSYLGFDLIINCYSAILNDELRLSTGPHKAQGFKKIVKLNVFLA